MSRCLFVCKAHKKCYNGIMKGMNLIIGGALFAMNLTNYFYQNVAGHLPEDPDDPRIHITQGTLSYLQDCGYADKEIRDLIDSIPDVKDCLTPSELPDSLWEGSLIERGKFYIHRELQILPPPPMRKKDGTMTVSPFYIEMKIQYTMLNLIRKFYNELDIDSSLIDWKRNAGSFDYLLKKYEKLDVCQPLDFVLELIALAGRERRISQIVNLTQYEKDALGNIRGWRNEAHLRGTDHIIWRTQRWLDMQ